MHLTELILRMLDNTITDEQLERLRKRLDTDKTSLDVYSEIVLIHSALHNPKVRNQVQQSLSFIGSQKDDLSLLKQLAEYEAQADVVEIGGKKDEKIDSLKLSEEERQGKISAFLEEERRIREEEEAASDAEARAEIQRRRRLRRKEMLRRQRMLKLKSAAMKTWKYTKITAVAALLALITYMGYLLMQPVPVATLTAVNEAVWYNSDRPVKVNSRLFPGPLRLTKGYAEITFDEGSVIILEAPAHITLETENKAFLGVGKLTAKVSSYSQGFTINTPTVTMIDLGTEFGVEVKEDGTSDLHTFKGQVVLSTGYSGDPDKESQVVEAGFAKRVLAGSNKIVDITFNERAFAKTTTPPPADKEAFIPDQIYAFEGLIGSAYIEAVRENKPVAYYRFDREGVGHRLGIYFDSPEFEAFGPGNEALQLDYRRDGGMGLGERGRGDINIKPSANNGWSMVLWVRANVIQKGNICYVALYTQSGEARFTRQLTMEENGRFAMLTFIIPTDLDVLQQIKSDKDLDYVTLISNTPAQAGRWHHLAVILAPDGHLELFIDGQPDVVTAPDGRLVDNETILSFFIGQSREDYHASQWRHHDGGFPDGSILGAVDEIAIYDRALSAEEIKNIYQSAFSEKL